MRICSFCPRGYDGQIVEVECNIQRGLPAFTIVGLPDSAVREARDRVRSAIVSVGADFPARKILINLSPGSVRKLGSGHDLAIAVSILCRSKQLILPHKHDESWLFLGELGLSGNVRGASFDYAALLSPQAVSFSRIVISSDLKAITEMLPLPEIPVYTCKNLSDLRSMSEVSRKTEKRISVNAAADGACIFLPRDAHILEALETTAAGFHNILLFGAPGSGKTTAARSMSALIPPMSTDILREQLRIHFRHADYLQQGRRVTSFREPHHSSSAEGILGGGKFLRPGELSLAHGGMLLLDESAEFHRHVLQNLREPMETGFIQLVRADQNSSYPCMAICAFTMNLCSCGNRGRSDSLCMCSESQMHRYWSQLGGAIYDRIEIKYFFPAEGFSEYIEPGSPEYTAVIQRITRAHERQESRCGKYAYNAYLPWNELIGLPECSPEFIRLLDEKQKHFFLSGRQRLNLLRISLTLLDLEGGGHLAESHLLRGLKLMRPENYGEYF